VSDSKQIERNNYFHMVADIAWFGLALSATDRFLSMFAIHLNASALELGLIASLPGLMLLISTAFAGWWRGRFPNSLRALLFPGLAFRLVFLLPAFAPFFSEQWRVLWLILAVTLPAIPQGIAGAVFVVLMRETVTDSVLTKLWSQRLVALNITVAISTLVFGIMLERVPFPYGYQIMFFMAFVFVLLSMWHVLRVKILYPVPVAPVKRLTHKSSAPLWRSPNFLMVIFVVLVTHVTFFSVRAMIPLHLVEGLGAAETFIAWFGLAELLGGALSAYFADRVMKRIGARMLIVCTMAATALSAAMIALAPSLTLTLIAGAINGAAWTATGIGVFGYFLERTPAHHMQHGTILYQQIISVGLFVGPLIGSTLADSGVPLVTVLLIGAGLRLLGSWLVMETRRSPQIEPEVVPSAAAGD
jgi:MFS family permease